MSENKEIVNFVKETGGQLVGNLYTDLFQPSIKTIGKTLGSVVEFVTLFQVPIQYINEKVKLNFSKRLKEYIEKLEDIPDEKKCEVNPQIGVPIMERLGYPTNDEIADLFTNLLTKASSVDTVNLAHPSFVQLIERLSVDEARIIKYLVGKEYILCISIRIINDDGNFIEPVRNKTLISKSISLDFPENEGVYLDNLVSMGILDISHGNYKSDETLYQPLLEKYSVQNAVIGFDFKKIEYPKSFYQITDFGKAFIKACNNTQ